MPKFVMFFTVARLGRSRLKMPGDFLYSISRFSESCLESDGNIGWAVTRCTVVFGVDSCPRLMDTFNIPLSIVYLFTLFCT